MTFCLKEREPFMNMKGHVLATSREQFDRELKK